MPPRALLRGVLEDLKQRHITEANYCPVLDRFIIQRVRDGRLRANIGNVETVGVSTGPNMFSVTENFVPPVTVAGLTNDNMGGSMGL